MKKIFKRYLISLIVLIFNQSILISQWEIANSNGFRGDVSSIVSYKSNVFAGTTNFIGGFFASTDYGNNWVEYKLSDLNLLVNSLAIMDDHLLIGTSKGLYVADLNNKNLQFELYLSNENINIIYVEKHNLFIGTTNNFYYGYDIYNKWNSLVKSNVSGYIVGISIKGDTTIVASLSDGIYFSNDNFKSWENYNVGLEKVYIRSLASDSVSVIVASDYGIYQFQNNTKKWNKLNNNLNLFSISFIKNINDRIYMGADSGTVYISNDHGINWEKRYSYINFFPIRSIDIVKDTIYLTSRSTIYKSTNNGNNWIPLNNYLSSTRVLSLFAKDSILIAGTLFGIFRSTNDGNNWFPDTSFLKYKRIYQINRNKDNLYCCGYFGICKSTNDGKSWELITPFKNDTVLVKKITFIDNNLFAATSKGLYVSSNNGINWQIIKIDTSKFEINTIASLNNLLLVGTNKGLYYSENLGQEWKLVNNSIIKGSIYNIEALDNKIFVNSDYLYVSFDFGKTWQKNLVNNKFYQIDCIKILGNNIFITTIDGLFYSNDNGLFWKQMKNVNSPSQIYSITNNNKYIFYGDDYNVYRQLSSNFVLSDMILEEIKNEYSIYPNPASDYMFVSHSALDAESIEIFNIFGEIQETSPQTPLLNERGLKIDISNLPAGVYFIKIGDKFQKFIKM